MSVYVVTYDLRKPGRNYEELYKALQSYKHCHALDSVWFLDTTSNASTIRDRLAKIVDSTDQIYVIEARKHWAAAKRESCTNWLKEPARSWG